MKNKFKNFFRGMAKEGKETKEMLFFFKGHFLEKRGSLEEMKKHIIQVKDILRMVFLIPFLVLPGSAIVIPMLFKIARKLKVELRPDSFR